jgi:tryptophan synthase beta subunit
MPEFVPSCYPFHAILQDVQEVVKSQVQNTYLEFEKRTKEVIVAMAEQGLNASLFYENPGTKSPFVDFYIFFNGPPQEWLGR